LDIGIIGATNVERWHCDLCLSGNSTTTAKKNKLKPWQVRSWCIPEVTPEFIKRMEHLLGLYQKPYDPRRPMVCFDEKSFQLLAHLTNRLVLKPGRATRQDYEYERKGTRNLCMFVEPKAGFRQVLVTRHRTKQDFAFAMRYLVDVIYPEAECRNVSMEVRHFSQEFSVDYSCLRQPMSGVPTRSWVG
jgi:hypothetical protein